MFSTIALVLAPPACPDDRPPCEQHAHPDNEAASTVCSLRLHHEGLCVSRGTETATILDVLCTDQDCRFTVVTLDDLIKVSDRG